MGGMKWKTFSQLTLIEQSLFGLPWILTAAFLPLATGIAAVPPILRFVAGIAAFGAARTAGMCFNRLIDKDIDAANPRTSGRALPSGEVTLGQVKAMAWINSISFILLCAMISPMCLGLSPFALFLIWAYSYTKRFTAMCHLILGCIHGFAVLMAWATVTGSVSWSAVCLAAAVMSSIAGMDIIYALQDRDFDQERGLHSIPVALGVDKSLVVARMLHLLTVALLINVAMLTHVHLPFYLGLGAVGILYFYYHRQLGSEVNRTFFRCNSFVSIVLLIATLGEWIWKAWWSA